MIKGFFAYASRPEVKECMSNAVKAINKGGHFNIFTWEEIKSGGTYIIDEICAGIDGSELFLADLTYLNHNVLFELGYAIAKDKRIVLFLDPSIKNAKQNCDRLNLSTIRYIEFCNYRELASKFLSQDIENTIGETFLKRLYPGYPSPPVNQEGVLYLKSCHEDDASIELSRLIEKSKIKPLFIDDPNETITQSVEWYLKEALQRGIILGHLVDDEREFSEFHNAKIAFCAGMGYAFSKNVLLLVKEPFDPSLDYIHLLKKYRTAKECLKYATDWFKKVEESYNLRETKTQEIEKTQSSLLSNAYIGNYIAEQEVNTLHEYYVRIINLNEVLKSDYSLLIGRKGSGKTALLYIINYDLTKQSKKNHVCIIKPVAYALEGLLKVLRELPEESEKSYLMESLWKFLIYTELAQSIICRINNRPPYIDLTKNEKKLKTFVENNNKLISLDFWTRFENILDECKDYATGNKRIKVSEFLHDNLISQLKSMLINIFQEDYENVVILVDNLDKTWKIGTETELLSSFLFGLISVASRIKTELNTKKHTMEFSLLIFLRSDIFSHIYRVAHERDKLRSYPITWNDSELLLKVIEERLIYNFPEYKAEQIWENYFCTHVNGIPVKEFIISNIVPRPRDIVYLVLEALRNTIIKGHSKIEEGDILLALNRYSQYALDSLIVESDIEIGDMEKLLYEFAGHNRILTRKDLNLIIEKSIGNNYPPQKIIEMLCDRAFLGRQTSPTKFKYQYSFNDSIQRSLQKNFLDKTGEEWYEVNAPYRDYLEIVY